MSAAAAEHVAPKSAAPPVGSSIPTLVSRVVDPLNGAGSKRPHSPSLEEQAKRLKETEKARIHIAWRNQTDRILSHVEAGLRWPNGSRRKRRTHGWERFRVGSVCLLTPQDRHLSSDPSDSRFDRGFVQCCHALSFWALNPRALETRQRTKAATASSPSV